jgi:transcriptional regulator with XRE-family HTH domain
MYKALAIDDGMNKQIKTWMADATTKQQQELAKHAGTSRGMLYQLASGQRKATVEMAARLEKAFNKMNVNLTRGDMSNTCASCFFYQRCNPNKGKKK